MNGEIDVDAGLMMIEDEQMNEEECGQEKSSPLGRQSTVIMTGEEFVRVATPDGEIGKEGSLPVGSFQSLHSSQSSEREKMITYVPRSEEGKVLHFEDALLEGKAGNLTDLTFGMVLGEKPPTWLQVMHERLKHLIINSEMFKEKKKA